MNVVSFSNAVRSSRQKSRLGSLACFLFLSTVAIGQLRAVEPPGEKQVYKEVDGRELSIYVTKPKGWIGEEKYPAIVFFHGGGWVGGAPGQFSPHAEYFASRGMVCFQVEYRLLDRKKKDPPVTCVQDAKDAFQWVREHAKEFAIDVDRIASSGGSAGGHLAAYLGCVLSAESAPLSKPNAMVLFNPVYDNGPGGWGTARVQDRYKEFSPMHNVSKDDPPSIVFLGTKDSLIPVATAVKFRERCEAVGVKSQLFTYEGQPHGFFNAGKSGGKYYYETVRSADEFLCELGWLQGKPTIEPPAPEKAEAAK